MSESMTVFNRRVVRLHRERAARAGGDRDFLFREVGDRLLDRLDDVRRRFPLALDLGCRDGLLAGMLERRGGIESLVQCDLAPVMASGAARLGPALAVDEEALPFAEGSFDLILSNLALHWVNDLPGALVQIRRALKPDGLFLAALLGGETLQELRQAMAEAELAEEGGMSPRVSPFADIRDAGNLLLRAGFVEPVADADKIVVSYGDPFRLMADLRAMGEANAVRERRQGFTRRATMAAAARRYAEIFAGPDGRLPATFQVIFLTAWAPAPTVPRAG